MLDLTKHPKSSYFQLSKNKEKLKLQSIPFTSKYYKNCNSAMEPLDNRNTRIKRRPSSRISDNLDQIPTVDISRKLHQLQSSFLTLRTNIQLRLSKILDPNIQIRSQLDREVNNIKQLTMKFSQLQYSLNGLRDGNKSQKEIDNAVISELQNKMMILEYKLKTIQRQGQAPKIPMILPQGQNEIAIQPRETTQMKILKDIMSQETKMRQKKDEFMNKQYEQLFEKIIKVQRQFYQKRQLRFPESPSSSHSPYLADINYLKDQVSTISSKISSDYIEKERKQHIMRQYIDSGILSLREELLNENKLLVENQVDTTKEINQSLQALYNNVNQIKQELIKDLETTQTLIGENVKTLSRRIDKLREEPLIRPSSSEPVSQPSSDLKNKIVHSIQMIEQRIIDIQASKNSKQSESENKNNLKFQELSTNVDFFQESLSAWTKEVQSKNISIFKQISTNLKNMKGEIGKIKLESMKRDQQITKTVTEIKQKIPTMVEQLTNLKTHTNQQTSKLHNQIKNVQNFVDSGKMQLQKLITQSLRDMELRNNKHYQYINQKLSELNSKVQQSIFQETQKLTKKISQQVSHVCDLMAQKDRRVTNQITIISEALRNNQIRTQGQVSQLQQKHMESYLKLKSDIVELQAHEAKLRQKYSERNQTSLKTLNEGVHRRIQFVTEGMKKAIQLNILKDKTQLAEILQKLRNDCLKMVATVKFQFTNDIYTKLEDEKDKRQRQSNYLKSMMQMLKQEVEKTLSQFDKQLVKIQGIQEGNKKNQSEVKASFVSVGQNMKILQQQSIYLKDQLQKVVKQMDSLTEQSYSSDQKLSKKIQSSISKMSNQLYVDNLFTKAQFSEHGKSIASLTNMVLGLLEEVDQYDYDK